MSKATKSEYLPPVRVKKVLKDKIKREAERRQTGVTTLIREAIIEFMEKK